MRDRCISRRKAIRLGAVTLVTGATGIAGRGLIAQLFGGATRVIVNLPWASILRVGVVTITRTYFLLQVVITLADGIRMLAEAHLTEEQVNSLHDGGRLILRSANGEEFDVPFTLRQV